MFGHQLLRAAAGVSVTPATCISGNDAYTKVLVLSDDPDQNTANINSAAGSSVTMTGGTNAWHQITTSPSPKEGFGVTSIDFNQTLLRTIIMSASNDMKIGTNDFVLDFWVNLSSAGATNQKFYEQGGAAAFGAYYNTTDGLRVYSGGYVNFGGTISLNTWTHVAFIGSGGNIKAFINGVQQGSEWIGPYNYSDGGSVTSAFGGGTLNGNMDCIRYSIGTNRGWYGGFTPPALPYCA